MTAVTPVDNPAADFFTQAQDAISMHVVQEMAQVFQSQLSDIAQSFGDDSNTPES